MNGPIKNSRNLPESVIRKVKQQVGAIIVLKQMTLASHYQLHDTKQAEAFYHIAMGIQRAMKTSLGIFSMLHGFTASTPPRKRRPARSARTEGGFFLSNN